MISGSDLGGANFVMFGRSPAPITLSTPTSVTVVAPPHPFGAADVTVATDQDRVVSSGAYAYLSSALSFYTLPPCRLVDTRGIPIASGAPALLANTERSFGVPVLFPPCGLPSAAKALSVNITVTQPTNSGDLRVFPGGSLLPNVSSINFRPGQTRANNAIIPLGDAHDFVVRAVQAAGTVQFILDVNGYFAEAPAPQSFTEFDLFQNNNPLEITSGSDGNLWWTEVGASKIGRASPEGVIYEFSLSSGTGGVWGIAAGPDGNLWYTKGFTDAIGRMTPAGVTTEFPLPSTLVKATVIAAGPDGNLWFTETLGNRIGRITTSGVVTEFTIPTANSSPEGITTGPDGNLWFTESQANKIGRITAGGTITEFPIARPGSQPERIAAGPDGALWFTEQFGGPGNNGAIGRITTAGVITEFVIPTPSSQPIGITAGADGNLWFTESDNSANKIARMTPSGVVTEFVIPTAHSQPMGITSGPDGSLWFTEFSNSANKIGRFTR